MIETSSDPRNGTFQDLGANLTFGLREQIGRAIIVGEFDDRPFPTEVDLARQYGVSRVVVREAVKMLVAKGLLSGRPRQGTFVRPYDAWNLFDVDILRWLLERRTSPKLARHFNELRMAVEPQAAAFAALRATDGERAAMGAAMDRLRAAEHGEDDALGSSIAFHVAVLKASGNYFFSQFGDVVVTAIRTSARYAHQASGRRPTDAAAHAPVYAAIAKRQAESARLAMETLINETLRLIERVDQQRARAEAASRR